MTPTIPESLAKLSRAWPTARLDDEAKVGYVEACSECDPRDVADAVHRLTRGLVQRAYPELIPPPGALATEITKSRNERLDYEARNRPRLAPPAPPPPLDEAALAARKAAIARIMAPWREQVASAKEIPSHAEHEAAKARVMLEALNGDETAMAAIRAENATIKPSAEFLASIGRQKQDVAA